MTEVRFYHLEHQTEQQVLPALLSKALERGHKIIVKLRDQNAVEQMDTHLWTFRADGFLPHGAENSKLLPEDQPIWLTTQDDNPNKADVLILCAGAISNTQADYALCCEILNGHDPQAVTDARARWKSYKEKEFDVTYWQQNDRGGWEKKA